ncbi:hypothetical protein F5Y13DRAFT_204139 [Hypoxylon sp. FL1857]|nr:hypothetical protein F5Y13DRAFT_204139 [Hypoxylon sp. FL1857]
MVNPGLTNWSSRANIESAAKVDIIAVHGLNPRGKKDADHAWDTWRTPAGPKGRLWLRDDLPQDLPESRIFLYEYNSTAFFGSDKDTFIDRANSLLEEIRTRRKGIEYRPILLLGHSMGGLLIKQALINAHNNSKYTSIKDVTRGLVFFATPHFGADGTPLTLGNTTVKIAELLGFQKGQNILETLQRNSIFSDIMQEHWRHQLEQYHIVSFWGTHDKIVPKESARLNLPGERENIVLLKADHSGVCKFGSDQTDQDNLWLVRSNIRDLYEEAKEAPQVGSTTGGHISEILKQLDVLPYRDRKDMNPERIEGTCVWFTDHELFRNWQKSKTSSVLWVSADPGCGKSVLARYLVDKVLPSTDTRTTCYFFFKENPKEQSSLAVALCCMLRQIIEQRPALLSNEIIQEFQSRATITKSFDSLWNILISLSRKQNSGEIVCIIDALDECERGGQSQLTDALEQLCYLDSSETKTHILKVLLTSRPYVNIQRGVVSLGERVPTIHLNGEDEGDKISREIDIFIKDKVRKLSRVLRLSPQEQETLQLGVSQVPHRTYLWVYLIFDEIKESIDLTKGYLKASIETLPQTVEEAYEKILSRSRDPAGARRLLSIVVAAERPLLLREMAVTLAIEEDHKTLTDLELEPEERFREKIRELCGLFVTIVDSKIYLLHQTAREFLVKDETSIESTGNSFQWKHSLKLVDAHRLLATICIWCLLFDECVKSPANINKYPKSIRGKDWYWYSFARDILHRGAFDYSVTHWVTHYREARFQSDDPIQHLIYRLFDPTRSSFWYLESKYLGLKPETSSGLILASFFGFEEVVRRLLRQGGYDIESIDTCRDTLSGQTALEWAWEADHGAVVGVLLDNGASIKLQRPGYSPLIQAVCNGCSGIAQMLLQRGARIDSKDNEGMTPLSHAATCGNDAIARLLLQHGASIESKDNGNRTPLFLAVIKSKDAMVRLLLEQSADIESRSYLGMTPLSYAVMVRDAAMARLLLEQGADIESKDSHGMTPLLGSENDAITQLLLEKGSNVMVWNNSNTMSPLFIAAKKKRNSIIRMLLEKLGVDSAPWCNDDEMSLCSVVESVTWLLFWKIQADPGSWDNEHQCPSSSVVIYAMCCILYPRSGWRIETVGAVGAVRLLVKMLDNTNSGQAAILSEVAELMESQDIDLSTESNDDRVNLFRRLISKPWDTESQPQMWSIMKAVKSVLRSCHPGRSAGY